MVAIRKPVGNAKQIRENLIAPLRGINTSDFNERISAEQAETIQNYFATADGRLVTREGLTSIYDTTGTYPSALTNATNDYLIYGYISGSDTKVAKYQISTDTSTLIHTFSGSTGKVEVQEYGNYFYFTNGSGKVRYGNVEWLLLTYTAGAGTFAVGDVVSGAISGTGTIRNLNVANTTLVLEVTAGTFVAGDNISSGGKTGTNIALPSNIEIPDSPHGRKLGLYQFQKGMALLVGDIVTNKEKESIDSLLQWADFNIDPAEIPFYSWSISTPPTPADSGKVIMKRGGRLNSLVSTRNSVVVFYDDSTMAFHLEEMNVDGSGLSQVTVTDHQEYNFGGARGAISTPFGIFYANEKGLWRMQLQGSEKEEYEITNVLDETKVDGLTFDDCSICFDGVDKVFFFLSEYGSAHNNTCFVFHIKTTALTEITGWNIARATKVQGQLYGIDSLSPIIYKLLDGYDDNGNNIDYLVKFKPLIFGDPELRKNLRRLSIKSLLSPSSKLKISFNYWDWQNIVSEGVEIRYQNGKAQSGYPYGVGKTGVGKMNYEEELLAEDLDDDIVRIEDFLKIQVVVEESAQVGHEIHYIDLTAIPNRRTVQNSLTKT